MTGRSKLEQAERIVVKVGSSLLTRPDLGLDTAFVAGICSQLAQLRSRSGRRMLLVTSGAVACGLPVLGWRKRPQSVADFHVAAAVGQLGLYAAYQQALAAHGMKPAQLLLSAEELAGRTTYLNSRAIVRRLFELDLLPIVNENDAVAMSERRFGDNDRLAAIMANLIDADLLVILTDVGGVYASGKVGDPAALVSEARAGDPDLAAHAAGEAASRLGSGGMSSKLAAAATAARGGADTVIADGRIDSVLAQIVAGEETGTLLRAQSSRIRARKLWLSEGVAAKGTLRLDEGAVRAVCAQGRSLLPVGVREVAGVFRRGDLVECVDPGGKVVARGLVNYDSQDAARLTRTRSDSIPSVLGFFIDPEMIHRDNLAVLQPEAAS